MRNNDPDEPLRKATPSVLNALAILESFDERHATQSLSELSRRLGIPKASAYRHLAALQQCGYVVRDTANGRYALGVQLLYLSRRFVANNDFLTVGRRHIAELAERTGETTHLSVLSGHEIVYADVFDGRQAIRAVVDRGDRLPAHCVASGKAILAHACPSAVREVLAAGLVPLTSRTVSSPEHFAADLQTVRALGYAIVVGEWMNDVSAIAAPVFADGEKVVGAIGFAGPRLRLGTNVLSELASMVTDQAKRLSRDLGGERGRHGLTLEG